MPHRRQRSTLTPIAIASVLALGVGSLSAAPRTFSGPGVFWDVVGNWSGGILPGALDDAILGSFNTEVRTAFTVNSFSGTGALTVSAGSLSFAAASSIGSLNFTGGTLLGAGASVVAGASNWTTGTMTGSGSTTFGGDLALNTNGLKDITSRTVNFNGTTTWSNVSAGQGRIRTGSSATLTNNGTWLDQNAFTNQMGQDFGGPASSFVNAGTYTKTGAATTSINIGFNNSGNVNVNAGTLNLGGGGTSNGGSFSVAAGTTLDFSGGTHTLNNISLGTGAGRMLVSGGIVNSTGTLAFSGTLGASGGTLNANGTASAAGFELTGGTIGGAGGLTSTGPGLWTAGGMTGSGSTTFGGDLALNTNGLKDITSRTVNFNGTTTWTNASGDQGRIRTGSSARLTNNGTWLDQNAFDNRISQDFGGPASSFVNAGTYTKTGAATTSINIGFSNLGSINVDAGSLFLTGGLTNFSGTTLTGGSFNVSGAGTFRFNGANVVTNAATIRLDGPSSLFLNASNGTSGLVNLAANTAAASFTIRNGRDFTTLGTFNNAGIVNIGSSSTFTGNGLFTNQATGQLQMAGGTYVGPSLVNAGLISGFGAVSPGVANSGTVRASGGALTLAGGVLGATGAVLVDTAAALSLGAPSTARNLAHNGALLALGGNDITVFNDYDNAGFGVGNSFDRRAGVTGAGQILASGTTQQTLTGALISGGNTSNATLALPNIRVGQGGVSASYTINNTGVGGPTLRGALVTSGINNAGLTGSGVTAQNWGAISQSGPGQSFVVNFDPAFGQALTGQVLQVVNNFDNVAAQSITFTGQAFNLAVASAATPSPVVFANQRVGGTLSRALTIGNIAPDSGFSERLNATIVASGTATAGGSFSLLAAGGSSSALFVGLDTSSAGARGGVATISLASDGAGTSGFSPLALPEQTVAVSGNVFRLAQPLVDTTPIALAARVGDTAPARSVQVSNTGADAFTERLDAGISATPANFAAAGAVTGLVNGSSSTALGVSLNTATAGSFNGNASVALVSSGAGTTLAPDASLGTSNVVLTGRVYAPAVPQVASSRVDFGIVRVGDAVAARTVGIANAANAALTDTLSATLNGGSSPFNASGSVNGVAAGTSNNSGLTVTLNTSTAGVYSASASLDFSSRNPDLADLPLPGSSVQLSAQVNRLAQAQLTQTSGAGSFSGSGNNFTLNFGSVVEGASSLTNLLSLANDVTGPADDLNGSFDLSGLSGGVFALGGFSGFSGLAAGSSLAGGLSVSFAAAAIGAYDQVVVLRTISSNASGPDLPLADITLRLQGTVVAVPEPSTYLMMLFGSLALLWAARRRVVGLPR